MLVLWKEVNNKKIQVCPYCESTNLYVVDYKVAEGYERRFGDYKFKLKCKNCNSSCDSLVVIYLNEPVRVKTRGDE